MSNSSMNAFSSNNFQRSFFKELESQFAKRGEMVSALSEALNVGKDGVYRRLRGDTTLSADELIVLAQKYNISLDVEQTEQVSQGIPRFIDLPEALHNIKSEIDYFRGLEQQLSLIHI